MTMFRNTTARNVWATATHALRERSFADTCFAGASRPDRSFRVSFKARIARDATTDVARTAVHAANTVGSCVKYSSIAIGAITTKSTYAFVAPRGARSARRGSVGGPA